MRQWRLTIVYAVGIFGEKPCQGKVGLLQKTITASFAEGEATAVPRSDRLPLPKQ
jgi:hypothetical protein